MHRIATLRLLDDSRAMGETNTYWWVDHATAQCRGRRFRHARLAVGGEGGNVRGSQAVQGRWIAGVDVESRRKRPAAALGPDADVEERA